MQINPHNIEFSNWYCNKDKNLNNGKPFLIDPQLQCHPFVYNSQQPKLFKLIIEWALVVTNKDKTFNLATLNATHEFEMKLDENRDKEALVSTLYNSHLNFEMGLQERLQVERVQPFILPLVDTNQAADNILALVRKQ